MAEEEVEEEVERGGNKVSRIIFCAFCLPPQQQK